MIIAMNAGNSILRIGAYNDEGELLATAMFSADTNQTSHELSFKVRSFLQAEGISGVCGCIVSAVNPVMGNIVAGALELAVGIVPRFVGPGIKTGLDILVKDPAQLGADLVAAAVAALDKYRPPLVIVSIGVTAITLSGVNKRGQLLGVAIAPSPRISLEALCQKAAYLPEVALEKPGKIVGTDTKEALLSGIIYGSASMIEVMIDKISKFVHNSDRGAVAQAALRGHASGADEVPIKAVFTGSIAPAILPYISIKNHGLEAEPVFCENLLLDGLFLLYRKNRDGRPYPYSSTGQCPKSK